MGKPPSLVRRLSKAATHNAFMPEGHLPDYQQAAAALRNRGSWAVYSLPVRQLTGDDLAAVLVARAVKGGFALRHAAVRTAP